MCAGMESAKAGSFVEARKRSTRGKTMEVIDVEPLASIDPTEKEEVPQLKQNMDFGMPIEIKLMGGAMKITRMSRRLAGMKPPTRGCSNSARGSAGAQGSRGAEKSEMRGVLYTPYWNVDKHSRLSSMDERRDWVDNLLPPGAKTKFEVYKGKELRGRIDYAVYEVKIFSIYFYFHMRMVCWCCCHSGVNNTD